MMDSLKRAEKALARLIDAAEDFSKTVRPFRRARQAGARCLRDKAKGASGLDTVDRETMLRSLHALWQITGSHVRVLWKFVMETCGVDKTTAVAICTELQWNPYMGVFDELPPRASASTDQPRKPVPGVRVFQCDECQRFYAEPTRDCLSPSAEDCPFCHTMNPPIDVCAHPEWPVDRAGNLVKTLPGNSL